MSAMRARGTDRPLDVFGVLLQQTSVGIALYVGREAGPLLLVDEIHDQAPQLGRVLALVLRLAEDDVKHANSLAQRHQDMAVMGFQLIAILRHQTR